MRVAYLGPTGTFSEEAVSRFYQAQAVELLPCPTILAVIEAVLQGEAERGVVPIENSIEGSVRMTLDGLLDAPDLFIEADMVLPVEQHLLSVAGAKIDGLKEVWSHPQAIAQCRQYLHNLGVSVRTFDSTAAAAAALAKHPNPQVGVLAPMASARAFHLQVLAQSVQDVTENFTRMGVIRRGIEPPADAQKTMLHILPCEEHYGVLASILNVFAALHLNLTWIESRPTRKRLGTYQFFLDVDGGMTESLVERAIAVLRAFGHEIRVLGSYRTTYL
ncbi:MAG: prephenate dehydratase [Alicyclobacillus sp.]|nr:prephenate dehydratase [Alicyclobacillus sp.]